MVGVSWYEALANCRWRAVQEKQPYRLPTEAEWKKAARGGLTGPSTPGVARLIRAD